MSAYGDIDRSTKILKPNSSIWKAKDTSGGDDEAQQYLVLHHLRLAEATQPSRMGLVEVMHNEFASEIERGQTYPQETTGDSLYTLDAFKAYFFSADVLVAIICTGSDLQRANVETGIVNGSQLPEDVDVVEVDVDIDECRGGREWDTCVAGFYYIKPNYPGRSSHICNAGVFTASTHRGKGFASIMARSYLHYAPKLGYQASVFNLVYANNVASMRIWDKLGFVRAGCIPKAGRLKRKDGEGEEYIDAWVYYKSFA